MPTSEFVEIRNGGYYVRGTRIHLDIVVYALRRGETAEQIFEQYPAAHSLAAVRGAITFIEEHPDAIERYLQNLEALWAEIRKENPVSKQTLERLAQSRKDLERRSA